MKSTERKIVQLLVALGVAYVTLQALLSGAHCSVPSAFLKHGDVGSAETSIHGIVLYQDTGTDLNAMYDEACWWYETSLFGIWASAVLAGTVAYLGFGLLWRRLDSRIS
jgi:hypothetical protein